MSAAFALTTAAPALAQYCAATVTYPCGSASEYISNVTIGAINNNTACGLDYEDFSATQSTIVAAGANEAISVTVSNWFTSDQVYAFCDWNTNNVLDDAGEVNVLASVGAGVYSGTVAVPPGTATGQYRMRVRLNYNAIPPACGNTYYGNIEDYTLLVGTPTTNPHVSGAATPNPCGQGQNVVLAATVVPGLNPTSTGLAVSGDLTAIGGGAAVAFLDNGVAPDVTAGDNVFTVQATVPPAQPSGGVSIPLTVTDAQARVGTGTLVFQVEPTASCAAPAGGGGMFPTSGTGDGSYPTVLPSFPLDIPLAVTVPGGATSIVDVKLNGMNHTYVADLQFTLEDPSGVSHNLVCRAGGGGDLAGDYRIYETFGNSFSTSTAPGAYVQDFGTWNSGDLNIFNTPLSTVPVVSGTYTLHIYDWAGGDIGDLQSWELCFNAPSGPTSYCTPTSPGTSNACVPTIAGNNNPNVAHSNSCVVTVSNVEGSQNGLIFYGINGTMATPWCALGGNSFLCVKAPLERGPVQAAGGTFGTCTGSLVMNWNAFQLANPTIMGNPWSAGDQAWLQGWFRDPPACKTSFLSQALVLTYAP